MLKSLQFAIKEWVILLLTVIIVGLFFYNKHLYNNRYNGYMYTDTVNYNELYFSEETYKIKSFSYQANDSLKLNISPIPQKTNWTITDSENHSYILKSIELPTIKLNGGINSYTISSELNHKCLAKNSITIEYVPKDNYTFIVNSTLPLIDYDLFPVERWTKLPSNITEAEKNETKLIIAQQIKINDTLPTLEKIKLISCFLVGKIRSSEGAPTGNMKQMTPLTQYKIACSKQNKVDCANYSDIFQLFATCLGIPTRQIALSGSMNNIVTTGHVFNECYIQEQGKWAFVDLSSKKTMVLNTNKEVLNSIDLLNSINAHSFEGKSAIIVNELNTIDTVNYSTVNQSEIDYFKPAITFFVVNENINENMGFKESFSEYLGTKSHYGSYYSNTIKVDNSKYYFKLFVFKASIVLLLIWCIYTVIKIILFFKTRLRSQ